MAAKLVGEGLNVEVVELGCDLPHPSEAQIGTQVWHLRQGRRHSRRRPNPSHLELMMSARCHGQVNGMLAHHHLFGSGVEKTSCILIIHYFWEDRPVYRRRDM